MQDMKRHVLGLAILTAACGAPAVAPKAAPLAFPSGFLFGTSTAGFQSEMGCPTTSIADCTDPNSDWYAFVTSPQMQTDPTNALAGQDPAVVGPGEWELYAQDFDRAKNEVHSNAFRMSIEWSRIFPTSTEGIEDFDALRHIANADAIAHYHAMLQALRARGLEPLVTINHYTLPLWISDGVACHLDAQTCTRRGWLDHDRIVHEIAKYAGFLGREFGGEVDRWATLNEPFAVVLSGFIEPGSERSNPPALSMQFDDAKAAFTAMIDAHARMYDAVHANDTVDADGDGKAAEVGLVYAMAPVAPADPNNGLDQRAATNVFYLWNLAFLDAVAAGKFTSNFDQQTVDRPDLQGRMDWLGINYYVRIVVQGTHQSVLPELSPLATFNPLTFTTDIYPPGIYDITQLVHDRYHLPMIITENNGMAVPEGDMATETTAIVKNLQYLERSIQDGADVRGWFYWSLTDNYEWNHGATLQYGLYEVDANDPTKTRKARSTVSVVAKIAQAGRVPDDLAAQYRIP